MTVVGDPEAPSVRRSNAPSLAVLLLFVSVTMASWWRIGDQTEPNVYMPDYMVKPPSIDPSVERAIGWTATVAIVLSLVLLAHATVRRRMDPAWWVVAALLIPAGWAIAYIERVVTMGVGGANIGGGFVVVGLGPVVLTLVIGAAAVAAVIVVRSRRPAGPHASG